jgi:nucleoside-diphosphate kinase
MIERTLSIIKPDATKRNITGKINTKLEEAGFRIIAQKRIKMTLDMAKEFYAVHKDKPFYETLCKSVCSGPVVVQVLEGEDVIAKNRKVMGATNRDNAEEGTIRREFALNITGNCVHGSDSPENAKQEIEFFFKPEEIVG